MFTKEYQELQNLLAGKRNAFIGEYLNSDNDEEFLLAIENFLPNRLSRLKTFDWEKSTEDLDKTIQSVDNAMLLYTILSLDRHSSPGTKYYANNKLSKLSEFKSKLLSIKHYFQGDLYEDHEFIGLTAIIRKDGKDL